MRVLRQLTGCVLVLVVGVVASVFLGAPAAADSGFAAGDVLVAQTLGERELTVVIHPAQPVPGPLRVEIVSHTGSPAGTMTLRTTESGASVPTAATELVLGAQPGSNPATLRVDHAGPWEFSIDDGARVARIPFVVAAQVVTPWEHAAYGGFFAAGVLLVVTLAVALVSKRGWPALIPAGAMIAALSVAITGATLSADAPPPQQPGRLLDPTVDNVGDPYPGHRLPTVDYSRPPVNLVLSGSAIAGHSIDLGLMLTDGASGRPVDDLLVHDGALMHLLVVGPSGRLWHLHPIRTGPGSYQLHMTPPEAGTYAIAAELSRRGGGVQLIRSTMQVAAGDPAGDGGQALRPSFDLTTSGLMARFPSTFTAHISDAADVQLWLGMVGHLIAVGPLPDSVPIGAAAGSAPVWAHVHAMAPLPMGVQPDETVAAFGPDISFTYTFPVPGRYLVWAQAERNYTILTTPMTINVRAEENC